jgi:PTS system cellobiose-specific IIB component
MSEQAAPYNVVVDVIPQDIYGMLDGEGLLDFALSKLEK